MPEHLYHPDRNGRALPTELSGGLLIAAVAAVVDVAANVAIYCR